MKMSNQKITGMRKLRREKKRLAAQVAQEKLELFEAVEQYTDSLWPVKVFNKFRKTADSLSENKFLIIGAQLAYAALNTVKQKRSGEGGIKEFLKNIVGNFIQQYMNKSEEENEDEEAQSED
ncbi:hypothetical protein BH11BAC7_BH11BAC7_10040 [soil metagenome]